MTKKHKQFPFLEKDDALHVLEILKDEGFEANASTSKRYPYCVTVDEAGVDYLIELGFTALTSKKKRVK